MNIKRNLYIRIFVFLIIIISCSPSNSFKKNKTLFNASPIITKYKAIADMNDAYFVIKENNFFEFYRQLFDSVKNTQYPGTYIKKGDTLYLNFYNNKGTELLGNKALINQNKKEIIFFDTNPGAKRKLIFN